MAPTCNIYPSIMNFEHLKGVHRSFRAITWGREPAYGEKSCSRRFEWIKYHIFLRTHNTNIECRVKTQNVSNETKYLIQNDNNDENEDDDDDYVNADTDDYAVGDNKDDTHDRGELKKVLLNKVSYISNENVNKRIRGGKSFTQSARVKRVPF